MIDIENLKQFLGSDEGFIATLIEKFLEEIPKDSEKLSAAITKADWPAVRAISHKMLSSTKIFNIGELTALLQQIEKISESGINTGQVPPLFSQFLEISGKVLEEMEKQKERLKK